MAAVAYRKIFVLKFNTPPDMSTCEYFLSANDAGLSSAAWKTSPSLENTLSGYNATETVGHRESHRESQKSTYAFGGPVNSFRPVSQHKIF